jgi:alpha-tubulin suppressor-like RCC1 family protein
VQLSAISANKLVKVTCGDETTAVITDQGEVYVCGRESATGLGGSAGRDKGNPAAPKEVEGLIGVSTVAFGSIHGIALISSTADLSKGL